MTLVLSFVVVLFWYFLRYVYQKLSTNTYDQRLFRRMKLFKFQQGHNNKTLKQVGPQASLQCWTSDMKNDVIEIKWLRARILYHRIRQFSWYCSDVEENQRSFVGKKHQHTICSKQLKMRLEMRLQIKHWD